MKIHYIGTCSGTEPMVGMHHTSIVFEVGDSLYWFDGGEGCAHSSYTSGMDVMRTRAIFVSHPHIDHIGGLANLLSLYCKLQGRYKMKFYHDNTIRVFFPGLEVFDAVKKVTLCGDRARFPFTMSESEVFDGALYEDENVRVSAIHNGHLKESGENGYHSFSYLIEAEGKRLVFSGDVASSEELDPLLSGGCDYLIHETGHHPVKGVLDYAASRGVKALRFSHHGREIIENRAAMETVVDEFASESGISAKICYDGMIEQI